MVSYAAPGGGVGPHVDSYDVFLLQGYGPAALALRPAGRPRAAARRAAEDPAALRAAARRGARAGRHAVPAAATIAHDGIARRRMHRPTRSAFARRSTRSSPRRSSIICAMRSTCRAAMPIPICAPTHARRRASTRRCGGRSRARSRRCAGTRRTSRAFIGRFLTEPKPDVVFAAPPRAPRARLSRAHGRRDGVRLDRRTQLLYDDARYYLNGDDAPLAGRATARRCGGLRIAALLTPTECAALSPATIDLLHDWHRHGFLAEPPDTSLPPPPGLPREERLDYDRRAHPRAGRRHRARATPYQGFDIDLSWGGWNAAARCAMRSARICGASPARARHHRARHALDRSVRRPADGAARCGMRMR